jgi:hypothetical protein
VPPPGYRSDSQNPEPWFSIAFPIGIVLALFGNLAIVGPLTLTVLPLNVVLSMIMFRFSRQAFAPALAAGSEGAGEI